MKKITLILNWRNYRIIGAFEDALEATREFQRLRRLPEAAAQLLSLSTVELQEPTGIDQPTPGPSPANIKQTS